MTRAILARDDAHLAQLEAEHEQRGYTMAREGRIIFGTASMMVDQIGAYVDAGVERFMLQWLDLDDIPGLELIAQKVLPHFHEDDGVTE